MKSMFWVIWWVNVNLVPFFGVGIDLKSEGIVNYRSYKSNNIEEHINCE